MKLLINIFFLHLKLVYFFLKLLPTKNKVVFLSRQSNKCSIDFEYIINELKKDDSIEICILCKKMDSYISYYFHFYKQMYNIATAKVCIIDSYIPMISVLNHKKDLKVLQIWHSLGAIKKFGLQNLEQDAGRNKKLSTAMKMHKNYTNIISSSTATETYFRDTFGYNKEVFLNYGLPRIDYLLKEKNNIRKRIHKKYPSLKNKKTILYAPTFRKDKTDKTDEILSAIDYKKYNIIVKSHPLHKLNLNNDRVYTCIEFKAIDLLTVSDLLITDYSAIALEGYVLDKKVYYYLYDYEDYKNKTGINVLLDKELPNCCFYNIKDLKTGLKKEYPHLESVKYKEKYLDNIKGDSTKLIVKKILEWIYKDNF